MILNEFSERTVCANGSDIPLPPVGVDEQAWIDVIYKMDEVYNDLLQYEVALEEKNAALEESQQFIISVLTSMSDVLIVCDRQGRILEVNKAMAGLFQRSDREIRGISIIELLADQQSRDHIERLLAEGGRWSLDDCELSFRLGDRTTAPVAVNSTPRHDGNGRFIGLVMTGRSVGELRRAYEALRRAHEDLKRTQQQLIHSEKMASLGRLVAGVAHELNNPISFVLGNVHAMQRYGHRLNEYLDAVHGGAPKEALAGLRSRLRIDHIIADLQPLIDGTIEGAERTRDIVAELKRFSAIDRSEEIDFNLAEIIERSVQWVVKASGARILVQKEIFPDLPLKGSPGQLQQVITNLVQNAIDSTERCEQAALHILARSDDGLAVVQFHDNGPGLTPEQQKHLFDPFYTTKPVGKGTGLGLAISYGIVERHGGRLAAGNHPEGGALMTLVLPLSAIVGGS